MKRICISAGLLALGATAVHAQYAPGLSSVETTKPWSFSASVRGFYDDNYLTLPKYVPGPNGTSIPGARDTFGVEVSPSITYNHSTSDTLISASYVYDLRWYEDRLGTTDQTHQFVGKIDHEFSERYKMTATEMFVVAQDPGILNSGVVSGPLRIPGSNIRNTATLDGTAQLSRLFDVHVGYANTYYAYQQNAGDEAPANSYPSYSASLDRMDQTATIDLRWKAQPETTGILGYQYVHEDYTSPEDIIFSPAGPTGSLESLYGPGHFTASSRDSDSHFGYLGVDENFTPTLSASVRLGAQIADYYNDNTTSTTPYADASLSYIYMPQSTLQVGVKHIQNSTDITGSTGTPVVLDEESTAVYLSDSHRVTSRFTVTGMAQAQYSTFNGGGTFYNGLEENFYTLNLNFAYHFNPWLTGETGYTYNKLNTEVVNRGYTRNEVYLGLRATY